MVDSKTFQVREENIHSGSSYLANSNERRDFIIRMRCDERNDFVTPKKVNFTSWLLLIYFQYNRGLNPAVSNGYMVVALSAVIVESWPEEGQSTMGSSWAVFVRHPDGYDSTVVEQEKTEQ